VPWFWSLLGGLCLLAALLAAASLLPLPAAALPLALLLGAALLVGGWLLRPRQGRRGVAGVLVLAGGVWATLALLFAGPLWLWELNETWPAPPVAALVASAPELKAAGAPAPALWQESERPSLNWYAGRRLPVAADPPVAAELALLSRSAPAMAGYRCLEQGRSGGLGLYRCQRQPAD
jgi:hypothetical protein